MWPPLLLALVVWMTVHTRRQPVSRVQPWLLYPVFAFLALGALGGSYETLRGSTEGAPAPLAGQRLLDVGGHRLNIAAPAPAARPSSSNRDSANPRRRWRGGSPRTSRAQRRSASTTAPVTAAATHPLLNTPTQPATCTSCSNAHVPGPYVIAGHSLGGMFALSYTHRYPTQVGGVVLLDSMHPLQSNAFAGMDALLAIVPALAPTGRAELFFDPKEGNPAAQARQFARDVAEMPAELDRAAKLTTLDDRPLAVISAGTGYAQGWPGQQDDLATLSSNTVHRTVASSTHASLIDDRNDAAQSSRAIRDVVTAVRREHG